MTFNLMDKPNVLLVDDSEIGLIAMESVLKECDYNLVTARSGAEALRILLDKEFAVILLDVEMPEVNGFETATYIKKREKTKNTPIIFVTGKSRDDKFVTHGYESGAVDYLFKPFDPVILKRKVAFFVDLFESNRQTKIRSELESRTRYRSLADAIPHIVWVADNDFSVNYINKTWSDYTGATLEKSLGSDWQSLFHPEDLPKFLEEWSEASQKKSDFISECRIFKQSSGDYCWHLVKAVIELDKHDSASWLITCTDIQNQKEIEEELTNAKMIADNANSAKSFFLANMSHEIRTPLGAIMGFSDLLADPHVSESDHSRYVETIRRNGKQLLRIIDEILDISKIESGSIVINKEKVNMREFLQTIDGTVGIQAKKKNLKLNFIVANRIPEFFFTDQTRLRQILVNILGNAIKFSSEGEVNLKLSFDEQNHNIIFDAIDTGPGIDEKNAKKLFKPFSQGDSSTSRKYGGTGLGLALSRKLARVLGGDLVLTHSEVGKGSQFTASIPLGTSEPVPLIVDLALNNEENRKKPEVINENLKLEGLNVLVADDSMENQILLSIFLKRVGANVDVAMDGESVIEKALSGNFHIVLMDIQMPIIDGYKATQILREKGFSKPILAITAHAMAGEKEKCLSFGCSDYLSKPINSVNLIKKINQHIPTSPH